MRGCGARVAVRGMNGPSSSILPSSIDFTTITNAANCFIDLRKRQSSISSREEVRESLWLDSLAEHVLADEGDDLASMVLFSHDPSGHLISHSK